MKIEDRLFAAQFSNAMVIFLEKLLEPESEKQKIKLDKWENKKYNNIYREKIQEKNKNFII